MLSLALPNGTLEEQTVKFFEKAGIRFTKPDRGYRAETDDPRIERVVFMRPHIIPYLVGEGRYDLGITGSDMVAEEAHDKVAFIEKLHFSRPAEHEWRLALFGGENDSARCLKEIEDGATILSEYPHITQEALEAAGKQATIYFSHGSTEAHIPHDFDYGVCIVSTETTLQANGCKIIEVLSVETAELIGGPSRMETPKKESVVWSLIQALLR